ncbi:MAG: nuclear transport factor 2 family protein [Deltaproteobacteria bacterium]|nr:nuclear transport factor 2 family protein [Deltaproteobacteria bacterium]
MSTEQNKEVVRRAMAALGRGDMTGFLTDADDDFTFTLIGTTPFSGTIRGKQAVLEALRNALGTRIEGGGIAMTIDNLIAEGDYVAEQARGKARMKNGKDYNNTYCRVWRMVNGKVKSVVEYLDTELVRTAFSD